MDVFELTPTKFLTQNEIDAAKTVQVSELNVQNQEKIVWSNQLVVAKAYVDQLERSQTLPSDKITELRTAIQKAEASKKDAGKLKKLASSLEKTAKTSGNTADSNRLTALTAILKQPVI